jgi:hypothetical protein
MLNHACDLSLYNRPEDIKGLALNRPSLSRKMNSKAHSFCPGRWCRLWGHIMVERYRKCDHSTRWTAVIWQVGCADWRTVLSRANVDCLDWLLYILELAVLKGSASSAAINNKHKPHGWTSCISKHENYPIILVCVELHLTVGAWVHSWAPCPVLDAGKQLM